MPKFVGLVYDPPRLGFPHLAVMFNEADMSKALVSLPVSSVETGEAMIQELARGLFEMASRDSNV